MSQQLPITIDQSTHPYLMRIMYAYRPHTAVPSRQQLMERKYQLDGHCTIKGITQQCGMDYKQELNQRR